MNLIYLGTFIATLLIASTLAQQNATQKADDSDLDEVIETILSSGRQGRNIDGLDDVYSDPSIKDALNSGDDAQARNLIKEKLCSLGLMQCDDAEGKRPYYSPDDLIYAQPIAIRPVGRPIPSVPVRGGPPQPPPNYSKYPPPSHHQGPYGAPKPMPVPVKGPPHINNFNGPPRKVGYSGPPLSKPYLNSLPFGAEGPVYFSKPPGPIYEGPDSPYEFVNPNKQSFDSSASFSQSGSFSSQQIHENKQHHHEKPAIYANPPSSVGLAGHASGSGIQGEAIQQHVHHHFHHGEPDIKVPVVVNPIPVSVPLSHGNSINSNEFVSSGYQSSGINSHLSTNGFTPMSSPNGIGGYYGKQQNSGFNSGINSGLGPVNGISGNGVYGSNYQSSSSLSSYNANGVKPVFENFQQPQQSNFNNQGPSTFGSTGFDNFNANTQFADSGTSGTYNGNSNTNSFHSTNPDYYKKELNINGGYKANGLGQYATGSQFGANNQYNLGEKYQAFETQRKENFDCVCVPYDQCQADDVIGRKDDLILPLDPRNINGKDIEALTDDVTSVNTTIPVIRVTKDVLKTATKVDETKTDEVKKISKRDVSEKKSDTEQADGEARQAFYNPNPQKQQFSNFQNQITQCAPRNVCCRRQSVPLQQHNRGNQCGTRNSQGITGRIKNPVYVDGDSEFGEYPWQVAILKKDPKESVYACGGTLIDQNHIITAAHCIKSYNSHEVRVRLGEWDVNHDVEFYPYIERDVIQITIHPEYYAGTLDNDIAILRLDRFVDYSQTPHISPACLPDKYSDYTGARCWTTGWGKDAFGDYGKYQNILKEVDVPIIGDAQCQQQLRNTRLGYNYKLNPGFICAGGEEGKDACKGDGGGPLVCERNGSWKLVGVVSWGIGCGQVNVPGVYVRVSHYLDWIQQITQRF